MSFLFKLSPPARLAFRPDLLRTRFTATRNVYQLGIRVQSPCCPAFSTSPKFSWLSTRISQIRPLSGRARNTGYGSNGYSGARKSSLFDFLNQIPEGVVFWGIIGLNGVVFLMWNLAMKQYQIERDPGPYRWMQGNFTSSWYNFSQGRIWTPLTAMFSHQSFSHILFNMFTFYFLARPVLSLLGTKSFLGLYLGGGLISSFGSMFWHNNVKHRDTNSLGASGAVFSTNAFLACVAPTMTFQLYGIIPIPAWLFVSGVFVWDAYSAYADKRGGTDTAGHVAGILAGIGYFLMKRFGF